jgi:cystinosin
MNSNYIFINLTGYAMYTVYNLYGYFKGDNPETGKVDTSDLFFSLHSVFVYSLTVAFYFYYPHNIQINPLTKLYLAIQWFVLIYFGFSVFSANKSLKLSILGINTPLKYFQTLGYFKMFSTLLKHPPQIYHNFKRKSTKGWSITGMIMDFFGGFFSLIALLLELSINPEFHVNHAKLFLSIVSMIYDVTYMIQHYGLYG